MISSHSGLLFGFLAATKTSRWRENSLKDDDVTTDSSEVVRVPALQQEDHQLTCSIFGFLHKNAIRLKIDQVN